MKSFTLLLALIVISIGCTSFTSDWLFSYKPTKTQGSTYYAWCARCNWGSGEVATYEEAKSRRDDHKNSNHDGFSHCVYCYELDEDSPVHYTVACSCGWESQAVLTANDALMVGMVHTCGQEGTAGSHKTFDPVRVGDAGAAADQKLQRAKQELTESVGGLLQQILTKP